MSASIGIRGYGTLGTSIDPLIRQADIAMYAAKSMGKGRYCIWNEAMGEK
jgi:PleD family two-component response regulator